MASSLAPSVSGLTGQYNITSGRGQSMHDNINPSDAQSNNPYHQPNHPKINHAHIDLVTGGFNENGEPSACQALLEERID